MSVLPERIIILGSSGFIGARILEKFLLSRNLTVKGFSSNDCDLLSADVVSEILSDLTLGDVLIMASAITRLKENSFNSMIKNIQMVENVCGVILKRPVRQLIYLSTVDIYGINLDRNTKISEKLRPDPGDYYALSKITGEFLFRKECNKLNIPLTVLRLSGVYGPGDKGGGAVRSFILSALNERKITIYGKGSDLRDYIYVDDVYEIINAAIGKRLNNTVNVATGRSYSIIQIAKIIKSLLPYKIDIEFMPKSGNLEKRAGDMIFDCAWLKSTFPGFKMTDLREGTSLYLSCFLKG